MIKLVATVLLVLIFFISGVKKSLSFSDTVKSLHEKLGSLPLVLCQFAILIAIFIEVVYPVYIVYSSYSGVDNLFTKVSIIGLIVFTIIATLIFHLNEPSAILKNVSIIGGLLLLLN